MKSGILILCLTLLATAFAQKGEKTLNQLDASALESVKKQVIGEPLTDAQVQSAILAGSADKNKAGNDIGLSLSDSGQEWANAMGAMGNNKNANQNAHSGFSVRMFSPQSWISFQAHEAKRMYKPYALSDVSESDRLPVLRVIVSPDTPEYVSAGGGMNASSGVEGVVLRSEDKKDVTQPVATQPYEVETKNAMGGNAAYNGVVALFSMADLLKLRKASEKKEFLVTVVGEKGKEKNFKVKEKHFQRLD